MSSDDIPQECGILEVDLMFELMIFLNSMWYIGGGPHVRVDDIPQLNVVYWRSTSCSS